MAHYRLPYYPDQIHLFPSNPRDWLREDHLSYFVQDVVSQLDMHKFDTRKSIDRRGAPSYSPIMMTTLLLYGWCRHVYSSRKLAALCHEDVGARVLTADNFPDHRSINLFRLRHQEALNDLFKQSVRLCQRAGMVSLIEVAVDGTKIEANASKRKAMSYARLLEEETRLSAEIDGYLKRAAEEDAAEDKLFGVEESGPQLHPELKRRSDRLARIRDAKSALEDEAQAKADAKQKEREAKEAQSDKPLRGPKPKNDPTPKDTAQRSFSDPESRIMKGGSGEFIQAFNGQAAVDGDHQVIVGCALTQQSNDKQQLTPLIEETISQTGCKPSTVLADPGYYSESNVDSMEAMNIHPLIPPDKERCGTPEAPAAELSDDELAKLSTIERVRHNISTAKGRDAYRRRKVIVEPVFGQMKGSAGNPGCLGFLRRGYDKCNAEWHWLCARHNIMKYIRFKRAQEPPDTKLRTRVSKQQRPTNASLSLQMAK